MLEAGFDDTFQKLTGVPPLTWQKRLYDRFVRGELPSVIDLPTGLGKTMVMAIWLIARVKSPARIPRRLVYVVDRRTVVDQATDLATTLQTRARADLKIDMAISTLRGQLADNREWSADPTRPAIIIGTVDLIGSALLFSGYRSSYRRRPLEAGLLGQDSLLVLDEAHLSKPFEKLLKSIEQFNQTVNDASPVKPMKVIRMSATSAQSTNGEALFTLDFDENGELKNAEKDDPVITKRFTAEKKLTVPPDVENHKLDDRLADEAIKLATDASLKGKRIVVFVRSPDDARTIAERIRRYESTKAKPGPYADSVEVLTGTMRGLERDELVDKPVMKRFLAGDEKPGEKDDQPVFLVSTSAGEVGFDLNADHMVCDATTIDSFIQRLGRVNRRGYGQATVVLVRAKPKTEKSGKPIELKGLELAIANTIHLLTDGMSLSPENIKRLKDDQWKDTYADACSPELATVPLTDILLDNWSMTSIVEPIPGRPEVGPWLRGIDPDLPQTTIAWRAELDLPGFADLDVETVEVWFDTHRILTHETLSDRSDRVARELVERWHQLNEVLQLEELARLKSAAVVLDRGGLRVLTVEDFMRLITDRSGKPFATPVQYAELILPASFGAIERGVGLLDADAPRLDHDGQTQSTDVADDRGRHRELITTNEDGERDIRPLVGGTRLSPAARFTLTLESDDDKTLKLVSYVPRSEQLETGETPQTLEGHVRDVCTRADAIIKALKLPENGPIRLALTLAAQWHDKGKTRERWQKLLVFPTNFTSPGAPMAKSGGEMKRDPRGYRHEFGSLREFEDAFRDGKLLDPDGKPITQDILDLAMHLIATHHGRGRPHFPKGGFDPDAEDCSEAVHTESIRRFARLQRRYGWWGLAWLENLLRCADALASANPETGVISNDVNAQGIPQQVEAEAQA